MTKKHDCLNKKIQGFSILELMIVVVIISILSLIAVPSYKDYVIRSKVSTLITMVQPTKLAVSEALIEGRASMIPPIENQGMAREIRVGEDHRITIIGDSAKLGLNQGPHDPIFTLTLTPSTDNPDLILWRCSAEPEVLRKYAPAECRG